MGGIEVTRQDLSAGERRHASGRARSAPAARRMLALALVMEGADRTTAARRCGMDRQTLLVAPGEPLAGDLVEAGAHAVELELGHGLEDLMAFHQATFRMLS
jgi:hypothetical protein